MQHFSVLVLFAALALALCGPMATATDIVTLDTDNFEHLTQAATGATTGAWLIKFYAPWCGHCKAMQPQYEQLATALVGEVNVAEVDASAHRSLGSRFDIKGFPTLVFLKGGKVFRYKGPRTQAALTAFVEGGYADDAYEAEEVPKEVGYVGEVTKVFSQSFKAANKDISNGNYLTINVLTCVMPALFFLFAVLLAFAPVDDEPVRRAPRVAAAAAEGAKGDKTE